MTSKPGNINWSSAWADKTFRGKILTSLFLLILTAVLSPAFFNYVEVRNGFQLNDVLLNILPAHDFSIPVFAIIWFLFLLTIIRSIRSPQFFLVFIIGYLLLNVSRFITITLVPLNPPAGIIELKDPLTNLFYGNHFVSKDLFYSGHTATLLLMSFCFSNKWDKVFGVVASVTVAVLLLIQHVHYSIDIIAAPVFAVIIYWLAKKIAATN